MTLSTMNAPASYRRELNDSVRELDNLLDDLKSAQSGEQENGFRQQNRRLEQQSHYYNSTASLYVPGPAANRSSRPLSASSPTPLKKLAASQQLELDAHKARLESEYGQQQRPPRGVFVKDVVEEEILVDHVHIQPQAQHSDRKFITTKGPAAGKQHVQGERTKRQVAFSDSQMHCNRLTAAPDDTESELYDNTDTEETSQIGSRRAAAGSQISLNSGVSNLTESSSVLDPSKVVSCFVCGERVVGQVITALGRNYHKQHFTCAHCHQELGTRNFYEKDNEPYCERDYQALFSPKCAACSEPILDKVTIALDQTFHPEHFVCAHCGCQFDADDGFHEKDGKAYCKNDFFLLFANRCAGCNLPITANYITALSAQWHPDCFVCSDCHCPFGDGKFFDIEGVPYCEIHYHARRGSLCAVCREPIIGKCTTAMFRKFHPDHFTCTYCLKVLSKSFKEENDKPYCHDCFEKLYS